jgi:hypothetical protein
MRRTPLIVILVGVFLLPGSTACQEKHAPLTNADVLQMVEGHFDEDTLLTVIELNDTNFDVGPGALMELKNKGVSPKVIHAMLEATQRKQNGPGALTTALPAANPQTVTAAPPGTTGTAAPAPNAFGMGSMGGMPPQVQAMMSSMGNMFSSLSPQQMPHVFFMGQSGKQEVAASTAQVAQTKFKSSSNESRQMLLSLAQQGLTFAAIGGGPATMMGMSAFSMAGGLMPGMRPGAPSMTYVWGLPGSHSSRTLTATTPAFEVAFSEIPGVDPDAYAPAVVRLFQTKDNYRIVGATKTKMNAKNMMGGGPEKGKWVSEERLLARLEREERGLYMLHVDQPLEPGEYALVLRAVKGYKAQLSGFGSGAQLFYSLWDFSVPGAPGDVAGKKEPR